MNPAILEIQQSIIGNKAEIHTAFGSKPLIYADYTASGRALSFIENFIRDQVLPFYANTHTEASHTGARTTRLREQARQIIRGAVNGTEEDQVIFCGSGATAAINKLTDILNLRLPGDLSNRYQLLQQIPRHLRPVVFIGPYEHHSNELPWRESIADVVKIPSCSQGKIDLDALETELRKYKERPLRIGSFSAASNVTGIKSEVQKITRILKRYDALAFWDYAAAAPYVDININDEDAIDGIFLSPHKFIGGPGAAGVLVVKRGIVCNTVPSTVGGGTVQYVTPIDHHYVTNIEQREEAGTPDIIGCIRAGLVFKLKQEVGIHEILKRERRLITLATDRLSRCPNVEILGPQEGERIGIFSLRFLHGDKDSHPGFIVALLNDLFGIQARSGCSCAGPYGHYLLDLDLQRSHELQAQIMAGHSILRPGWVRLNFNYFIDDDEFDYLLKAIELLAINGWRLLSSYHYDDRDGVWKHNDCATKPSGSLNASLLCSSSSSEKPRAQMYDLSECYEDAHRTLLNISHATTCPIELPEEAERLRWFKLPQEIAT